MLIYICVLILDIYLFSTLHSVLIFKKRKKNPIPALKEIKLRWVKAATEQASIIQYDKRVSREEGKGPGMAKLAYFSTKTDL